MCEICQNAYGERLTRRSALTFTASALAAGLVGRPARAANDKTPPKPQNVISPDAALDRLMKGNSRYIRGTTLRHDFAHEREALSAGQNPFAAILSCADSRIAPELCFDTARGDLFVCRVAGNFASDEMVASLEYAVQVLKTAFDHGAWARSLRRGGRHHQIGEGRLDAARSSAVPGRSSQACG
jgi:carbonic anhydrase